MKKAKYFAYTVIAALLAMSSGCASTPNVQYIGDRERPLTDKIEADDIRRTVEFMADDMLVFPPLVERSQTSRPVLDVEDLKNASMQHIDTKSLTDSLRTRLIRSGKFRFKDRGSSGTDLQIINEENEVGLVDSSKAVKAGKQIATELYLSGRISQIRNTGGREVDNYYKITLTLKDLESGEIFWTNEMEVRKQLRRSTF